MIQQHRALKAIALHRSVPSKVATEILGCHVVAAPVNEGLEPTMVGVDVTEPKPPLLAARLTRHLGGVVRATNEHPAVFSPC